MTTPEIEELKSLIEQKYGKMLCTTTDFEEFSIYLKQKWGKSISYYHRHQVTKQKKPLRSRTSKKTVLTIVATKLWISTFTCPIRTAVS